MAISVFIESLEQQGYQSHSLVIDMPLEVAGPAVFPNDGPARRNLHSEDSRARKSARPASCRQYHFPSLMKGTPVRLPDCKISPAHLGVRFRECLAAPSNWRPIVLQDGDQGGGTEPEHKHAGHRLKRGQQAPAARQDDIAIVLLCHKFLTGDRDAAPLKCCC
jgi:hypothetical protein